jgi:hypothetical protein
VQQDRAAEDEVGRTADALRRELLYRAHDALDGRAECLRGNPEAAAELESPVARLRLEPLPVERRPLGGLERGHIGRHDLSPAPLHLERPEAVEGADVDRPLPRQVAGKHLRGGGAEVDVAGGDHARRELDRVVPAGIGGDRLGEVQKTHLRRRLKSRAASSLATKSAR